jgi:hypothetical protein
VWQAKVAMALVLMLPIIGAPTRSGAQEVAKVDAANGATATSPGGATRPLGVGSNVRPGEKVNTTPSGSAHVTFSDQSSVSVGRDSTVGIDKYSYDKNTKSGSAVLSAVKGALRYVGGQISHGDGAEVKTPAATLGIRGGIVTVVSLNPSLIAADRHLAGLKGWLVIPQFGNTTIMNSSGIYTAPNGFAFVLESVNSPVQNFFKLSEAAMQIIKDSLTSGPTQTGGIAIPLTNQYTLVLPGTIYLPDPAPPPGSTPLGFLGIISAGNTAAQNKAQTIQAQNAQNQFNAMHHPPPACGGSSDCNGPDGDNDEDDIP